MLAVTPGAAQVIKAMVAELPDGGLRIASQASSNGHGGLTVSIVETPAVGDVIVREQDTQIFVDEQVAPLLDDKTLDVTLNDDRLSFTITG
jgi:Fe-S cluster assembly iron-binding protein IscA